MPATVTVISQEEEAGLSKAPEGEYTIKVPIYDKYDSLRARISSTNQAQIYDHILVEVDREIDVGEVARVVSSFKSASFIKSITFVVGEGLGDLQARLQQALA
jgi:hypothetical protein